MISVTILITKLSHKAFIWPGIRTKIDRYLYHTFRCTFLFVIQIYLNVVKTLIYHWKLTVRLVYTHGMTEISPPGWHALTSHLPLSLQVSPTLYVLPPDLHTPFQHFKYYCFNNKIYCLLFKNYIFLAIRILIGDL